MVSFATEHNWDSLDFYDGADNNAPRLGSYSGDWEDFTINISQIQLFAVNTHLFLVLCVCVRVYVVLCVCVLFLL